jgi:DNA-directed RNA polymerase sigma subunit (sigma70/sigma32)
MMDIIENPDNNITISNNTIETIKNKPSPIPLENYGDDLENSFSPIGWLESSDSTDSIVIKDDLKNLILSVISELKPIERQVTLLKYGLGDEKEPMSYRNIGEKMEKTAEWARGISKKAERRMYSIIRKRQIKNLLF